MVVCVASSPRSNPGTEAYAMTSPSPGRTTTTHRFSKTVPGVAVTESTRRTPTWTPRALLAKSTYTGAKPALAAATVTPTFPTSTTMLRPWLHKSGRTARSSVPVVAGALPSATARFGPVGGTLAAGNASDSPKATHNPPMLWTAPRRVESLSSVSCPSARRVGRHRLSSVVPPWEIRSAKPSRKRGAGRPRRRPATGAASRSGPGGLSYRCSCSTRSPSSFLSRHRTTSRCRGLSLSMPAIWSCPSLRLTWSPAADATRVLRRPPSGGTPEEV